MAIVSTEELLNAASSFGLLSVPRQIGVLLGVASAIALAISVALWSREPNFRPLFSSLTQEDTAAAADALQQAGVDFRIDPQLGTLLVAGDRTFDARRALAAKGLPKGDGKGYEMLTHDLPMGSSQFIERIRYINALEGELSRTIGSFNNVKSARVHVALPKQSSFIRDQGKPSASVLLDIYGGRSLDAGQVDAVVHLIASSIPELATNDITVVDQKGNLLTNTGGSDVLMMANQQFRYTSQLETQYSKRIEDLLVPLLGVGKVRARVSAEIDFTQNEQAKETYNPDLPSLRSEQLLSENKSDAAQSSGIPGALSNQASSGVDSKKSGKDGEDTKPAATNSNERKQQVRNYELDKVVSHTKQEAGRIDRLSVAVLVDNHSKVDADSGEVKRTPLSAEEIQRITKLVRDAVGFNAQRGDSVSVINSDFATPPEMEKAPDLKLWEQAWFWGIVKQVMAGLFVLLIVFAVIKPFIKGFASKGVEIKELLDEQIKSLPPTARAALTGNAADASMPELGEALLSFDDQMRTVKNLASDDPKRVAQVVKKWIDVE